MNQATTEYQPDEEQKPEAHKIEVPNQDLLAITDDAVVNVDEEVSKSTELVVDLKSYDMVSLFSENGADPLLDEIEKQAESIVPDISSEKGRKEIASMAYKIAKSKTALDKAGKELKEEAQKTVNVVDAERKKIRDRMDALKDKVRAPLTEFEEKEKERVASHELLIESLNGSDLFEFPNPDASQISERIKLVEEMYNRDWEEFSDKANDAYIKIKDRLHILHSERVKYEAEQKELEDLRKEKEERERKEREDALKKEAAEKARKEAEEKAQAEKERIEKEKQEAEQRAKDAEAKAKADAEQAERAKKEASERAEREKQEAIENERKRQEDEKRKAEQERQKREADKAHFAKINNEVLEAIKNSVVGVDEAEREKAIVTAIAQGKIPHVKINY